MSVPEVGDPVYSEPKQDWSEVIDAPLLGVVTRVTAKSVYVRRESPDVDRVASRYEFRERRTEKVSWETNGYARDGSYGLCWFRSVEEAYDYATETREKARGKAFERAEKLAGEIADLLLLRDEPEAYEHVRKAREAAAFERRRRDIEETSKEA